MYVIHMAVEVLMVYISCNCVDTLKILYYIYIITINILLNIINIFLTVIDIINSF